LTSIRPSVKTKSRKWLSAGEFLRLLVVVAVVGHVLAGCSSKPSYFRADPEEFDGTGSVAVMPLLNMTRYEAASDIIMDALVVELLDLKVFEVVDPGVVEVVVLEKRLRLTDRLPLETIQEIGERLQVEYLLVGSVSEFEIVRDGGAELPNVSISLRLIECSEGHIVWAATHSERGDDAESVFGIGRISTPEQLASAMVKDMIGTLKQK
jgi:TolB-like protein